MVLQHSTHQTPPPIYEEVFDPSYNELADYEEGTSSDYPSELSEPIGGEAW